MSGFRRLFADSDVSFRIRFAGVAFVFGKALEVFGWALRTMEIVSAKRLDLTCGIDLGCQLELTGSYSCQRSFEFSV